MMDDKPFCARCKEDAPVAKEPANWTMGWLRPITKAPLRIRRMFPKNEITDNGNHLCGNCFFDLTD